MTAPAQTVLVQAPASGVADLRKDDPPTAVDLWKRRLAATPEAVAFRYFDKDAWQGMTFREADAIAREIAAGLVARGVTTIGRPGSAAISYPGFFDDLERVRA